MEPNSGNGPKSKNKRPKVQVSAHPLAATFQNPLRWLALLMALNFRPGINFRNGNLAEMEISRVAATQSAGMARIDGAHEESTPFLGPFVRKRPHLTRLT